MQLYALGAMVVAAAAVTSFALLFSSLSSVLPVLCAMGSIFVKHTAGYSAD